MVTCTAFLKYCLNHFRSTQFADHVYTNRKELCRGHETTDSLSPRFHFSCNHADCVEADSFSADSRLFVVAAMSRSLLLVLAAILSRAMSTETLMP